MCIIPYLRVYHIENYVIHSYVVLHGGSCSKNTNLKHSLLLLQRSRRSTVLKRKHPLVRWFESWDHLLASGVGILRLMPASDLPPSTTRLGVFSFIMFPCHDVTMQLSEVKILGVLLCLLYQGIMMQNHITNITDNQIRICYNRTCSWYVLLSWNLLRNAIFPNGYQEMKRELYCWMILMGF